MKNSFIIVIIGFLCLNARKRDFDSFWQLYVDENLVKECTHSYGYCSVELKKMDLFLYHKTATIKYFRDTPCDICSTSIQVKNIKDSLLFEATSYGTGTPISFPLRLLYEYKDFNSLKIYFKEKGEDGYIHEFQMFQFDIK